MKSSMFLRCLQFPQLRDESSVQISAGGQTVAFLLNYSLLVEFFLGGVISIIVNVLNNELGATWCCE